jgi:hypothetical protein
MCIIWDRWIRQGVNTQDQERTLRKCWMVETPISHPVHPPLYLWGPIPKASGRFTASLHVEETIPDLLGSVPH